MGYLISIIVFQTFFALLLLVVTRNKKDETVFKNLLIMYLGFMALHFSVKLLFLLQFNNNNTYFSLPTSFSLIYGPVIYLLTLSAIKKIKTIMVILHFLPFLIVSIFYIFVLVQLYNFPLQGQLILPYYDKLGAIFLISPLVYPIINMVKMKKHKQDIDALKLKLLLTLNVLVFSMPIILFFISAVLEPLGIRVALRLVYILMLLMIIAIVIYKFKNREQLLQVALLEPNDTDTKKYTNSKLSVSDLDAYQLKVETYFKKEKPFLDPELTLQRLSSNCGIPKHHLTQLFNTRFNKNFYQFINEFRVQEVIEKIPSQKNMALVEIAYECGFNSKSTFNSYFKKITGLTPSNFKKSINPST